jgi:phosphatidylglycerol:prolipoprotein diacylglycerol transferase
MLPYLLNPVAFKLGPITVHWYGIILAFGALVGLLLAIREGRRFGIPSEFFMDLMLIGAPTAIICARIYYVIFEWENYRDNPIDVIKIWEGGIAIHGALIGAVLAGIYYCRKKGYGFWRIADIAAPSLIIGQMIGRWGNFMNQEAHGGPVDEAFLRETLHIPNFIVDHMYIQGVYYHPTFLYESIWNLAGFLVLLLLRRAPFLRAGELFFSYLIWYSFGRFFIEGLRTDSLAFDGPAGLESFMHALWAPMTLIFGDAGELTGGNIRTAQFISLLLIVLSGLLIALRRVTGMAHEKYKDPIRPEGAIDK